MQPSAAFNTYIIPNPIRNTHPPTYTHTHAHIHIEATHTIHAFDFKTSCQETCKKKNIKEKKSKNNNNKNEAWS